MTASEKRINRQPLHVLIVEDDPLTLRMVSRLMQKAHAVFTAKDAEDAIAQYMTHAPDIVFLDIGLPGTNGFEVLRHIRRIDPYAYGSGYQGITRFKNGKLTNWSKTGFVKDNNCESLLFAPDGKLYACTENGVTLIDPAAAEPMVSHYPFQEKFSRTPELFGGYDAGNTVYWFYGSRGLYRLQNGQLVNDFIRGMPVKDLYINKIISDRKGNIWVATLGKGLLCCRQENGQLVLKKQYDSQTGLPSNNALSVLKQIKTIISGAGII